MEINKNIKQLLFYLKSKGWKWTWNYLHFITFYDTKNPILIKYLQWFHPYPSYIEVECTTRCPIKCKHCEHTWWNEPSIDMSFDQFKHIFDQFPNLKWIGMTGIGEEFINPDFMDMLRYVKHKKPDVFIELYDSFLFLDEKKISEMIDLGIERIFASIDGATKETYEKVRVGAKWEKVVKNIETFVRLKKEKKAYFPQLCFHYIVTKDNFHEMKKYVEWVSSLGTDVKLIQFSRMLHFYKEARDLFIEVPEKTIKEVEKKADELGINVVWSLDVPQKKPPINRCTAFMMPFIFVNGDVIPCCAQNEGNRREWQHKTSMGNIFNERFKKIWNGKRYRDLIRKIRKNETPEACKGCPLFEVKK